MQKTETIARLKAVCILVIIFNIASSAAILAATQTSVATRQIFNSSWWPEAFQQSTGVPGQTWQLQSLERFILNERKSDFRFRLEFELAATHFSTASSRQNQSWQTRRNASGFKAIKSDSSWLNRDNNQITAEIERCEISFYKGKFDFQLGRQPVSFGTSHYVSIMDVLTPFQPGYLDSSYKPGIDALRIRTLSGTTGEQEIILAAADDSANNAIIGRWRDTFAGFDLEIVGGRFRKRNFFAAGWEGERKKINFWGEIGIFRRMKNLDPHLGGISKNLAISWIAGIEKDTGRDWRHGIAFLHQDFGARTVENLGRAYASQPLQQGWAHLAASDYIIFNSNKEVSPLINFNLNSMLSLVDHSILLQPVLNISLDDESDISFFCWLNSGSQPKTSTQALQQITSEFGSFPSGAGFILRRFF